MIRATLDNSAGCDGFVKYGEWIGLMPEDQRDYGESVWKQRSARGEWAPWCKAMSQRTPTLWRKSDLVSWTRLKFGLTSPSSLQAMLDLGWPEPQPIVCGFKQPKKRRGRKLGKKKGVTK